MTPRVNFKFEKPENIDFGIYLTTFWVQNIELKDFFVTGHIHEFRTMLPWFISRKLDEKSTELEILKMC